MRRKELAYVSFENAENLSSGVNKKIVGQIGVFNKNGFHTRLVAVYGENIAVMDMIDQHHSVIPASRNGKMGQRQTLCGWAAEHASEFDCAYIRFQFFALMCIRWLNLYIRLK